MSTTSEPDGSLLVASMKAHIWGQVAPAPPITTFQETLGKLTFGPDGCGLDAEEHIRCGDDGRTVLMCAAPDFSEEARSESHEAVLLTTTVDVPHAGLP